jgi:type II secretion system protein N
MAFPSILPRGKKAAVETPAVGDVEPKRSLGRRLLVWGAYALFGEVCFFLALVLTFPYDLLKSRVEQELSARSGFPTLVGDLSMGPRGLSMEAVKFSLPPPPGEKKRRRLELESLSIRPALLALIKGQPGASFHAALFGGTLAGSFIRRADGYDLDLAIETLDTEPALALVGTGEMKFRGVLDGTVNVNISQETPKDSKGQIDLKLAKAGLAEGKLQGFTLPAVDFGDMDFQLEIEGEKATIKKLESKGNDVEITSIGDIFPNYKALGRSRLDVNTKLKVSPGFWTANQKLAALKDAAFGRYLRKDGAYGLNANGFLSQPSFRTYLN